MPDKPVHASPFRVLYRVFYERSIAVESLSASGDPQRLMGQLAGILLTLSMLLTVEIMFVPRAPAPLFLWKTQHMLLSLNLLVAGLLAVFQWEAALPDRRDLLVLMPLPVSMRILYEARLASLATIAGVACFMLNMLTGLSWPFLFAPSGLIDIPRAFAAYWISMVAVALFPLCAVIAVQGLASLLLPWQLFLRASSLLQSAAFMLVVGSFLFEPSLSDPAHQPSLLWLPSYWFLGFYQELNGSAQPWSGALALRAVLALALAILLAVLALVMSYLRTSRRTLEQPDLLPLRWIAWFNAGPRPVASALLRGGLAAALTRFTLRSLLRSRQRRILLSACVGIGLAAMAGMVFNPFAPHGLSLLQAASSLALPILAVGILFVALVAVGVRVVSSLPISLRANWLFRVAETQRNGAYRRALRVAMLFVGVLPPLLLLAALFLARTPSWKAAGYLLLLAAEGALVVELSLAARLKIPFTCAWRPGKAQVAFTAWAVIMFSLVLAMWMATWIVQALQTIPRFLAAVGFATLAWIVINRISALVRPSAEELAFTDEEPEWMVSLRLSGS
ncbi:hypothetical protein [Silvibacterium dinghuense]|uniref:ABC-2 type transport system permease protein n=1 Tax=Silvibacterium dinghuense TaxID=1560006 RepID=A0A4Q1SK18_9BACT|nr:hypothetical protein [Silvibacterium dinghuense]RXS97797.1 hypothetical protein ESZ00_08030 [Silvibacterium dinghuense]GGH02040.1 hypothetical protein GCM10011586_17260 [Silvibacterium dinghuense]